MFEYVTGHDQGRVELFALAGIEAADGEPRARLTGTLSRR